MQKKVLFIFNPVSGRGIIKQHLVDVITKLSDANYQITIYPTKSKYDALERVKSATEYDYILVAGGDGTLSEVISGCVSQHIKATLGYLPTGTTNDFATGLTISKNVIKSVTQFILGRTMAIDVGQFNDRYFTYVAAFGAFTDVAYETPQLSKNVLGRTAYLIEGLLRLTSITAYTCTIMYDKKVIAGNFVFGMISNSDSVAGILSGLQEAVLVNDGLFEVTLVKMPKNVLELPSILGDLLNAKVNREHVITFKTKSLTIISQTPLKWTLDGEEGGNTEQVTIKNLQNRVQLIVPSPRHKRLG